MLDTFKLTNLDYLEISIDNSTRKLKRLELNSNERKKVKEYMDKNNVYIYSIVLSANRSFPIGSHERGIRNKGINIMKQTIDLAYDLSIPIIQVAGYYALNSENRNGKEKKEFIKNLKDICNYAARKKIMLGIENVDGLDVLSINDCLSIVNKVGSPWLKVYPDVGNLVANSLSFEKELEKGLEKFICIHLKDTKINTFRRVPFGEGEVNFKLLGQILKEHHYKKNFTVEMWNDNEKDNPVNIVNESIRYLKREMNLENTNI